VSELYRRYEPYYVVISVKRHKLTAYLASRNYFQFCILYNTNISGYILQKDLLKNG
jgi:hypothetical protein